jgi:TetR/AcrR family transcriptional regulator, mexJK operon transcriptional repressor
VSERAGEILVRVSLGAAADHPGGLDPRVVRTRAAVVEAATGLFLERGYLDTSIDDIAARASVSKKTIYNNFADKERLFTEIVLGITTTAEEFAGSLAASVEDGDVPGMLHALARRHLESVTNPAVVRLRRLISAESGRFPDLAREYYRRAPGRVVAAFADTFADLAARGRLHAPDPTRAAEHFAFLVVGAVLDRIMFDGPDATPDADERERIAQAAVVTFLAAHARPEPGQVTAG